MTKTINVAVHLDRHGRALLFHPKTGELLLLILGGVHTTLQQFLEIIKQWH